MQDEHIGKAKKRREGSSLSAMDAEGMRGRRELSDSEMKNLHQYSNFNSNISLIHTPCLRKIYPPKRGKNRDK